jgi:F420-0:gamma-glutamyl ligase-like protein
MQPYMGVAVTTPYWRPGADYVTSIVESLRGRVRDGDFVTVSEKALSTAAGHLVDEAGVSPGCTAKFLARCWMRYVWAYVLGPLCHLRRTTIGHFRRYPLAEGSVHKQVVLEQSGLLQALLHSSEGAMDGSNLPFAYVSLPLSDAGQIAGRIRDAIEAALGARVTVVVVDTDKTYSWRALHFSPRPTPMRGIWSVGGVLAYVLGRALKLRQRATPVAVSGAPVSVEQALAVAAVANRSRGVGAGRTIWAMAATFQVPMTRVSWAMLEGVEHRPIVIVRRVSLGGM